MSGRSAVFRREFSAALASPIAWVSTILMVGLMHAAFYFLGFPVGDRSLPAFWIGSTAALDALFAWLPLFFAVLAPALTMGAWAEERRSGTDEILLTLPVRTRDLVLGKFLAGWLLLTSITALAILPLAAVVANLGQLDWGTVWGGLIGATLLAGVSIAIGLTSSSWCREELVSFLVASALLFGLWSLGLFVRVLPGPLAEAAWYASPALHFLEGGARGVIDARDFVYHGLFIAAGILLNVSVVEGRRWR